MHGTSVRFYYYLCKNRHIFQLILISKIWNFIFLIIFLFRWISVFGGGSDHSCHDTDPERVYNSDGWEVCSCKYYSHHEDLHGHFCLCGHKMAAWSKNLNKINHDCRHCLFHKGTILKLIATIHEWMNNILSFCTKYVILNISAKYEWF